MRTQLLQLVKVIWGLEYCEAAVFSAGTYITALSDSYHPVMSVVKYLEPGAFHIPNELIVCKSLQMWGLQNYNTASHHLQD